MFLGFSFFHKMSGTDFLKYIFHKIKLTLIFTVKLKKKKNFLVYSTVQKCGVSEIKEVSSAY